MALYKCSVCGRHSLTVSGCTPVGDSLQQLAVLSAATEARECHKPYSSGPGQRHTHHSITPICRVRPNQVKGRSSHQSLHARSHIPKRNPESLFVKSVFTSLSSFHLAICRYSPVDFIDRGNSSSEATINQDRPSTTIFAR